MPDDVALLVNAAAGRGRGARAVDGVRSALTDAGLTVRVLAAGSRAEAERQAHAAVAEGVLAVAALGGDGVAHAALQAVAGTAMVWFNPTVRSEDTGAAVGHRREWFTRRFVAVILLMSASTLALAGTDVAAVAVLNAQGEIALIGLVMAAWGFGSMLGGFVYGGLARAIPSAALVIGLGLVTIPLGLAHSWWVLALALIPVGALCAPSVSATVGDVSRIVPEARRGEAMGWHSTAATMGVAIGAPVTGLAIDHAGPGWGFVAAGVAGTVLGIGALLLLRTAAPAPVPAPADAEAEAAEARA